MAGPDWRWAMQILGDPRYSVVLDNSKMRRYVPDFVQQVSFYAVVDDIVRWHQEHSELTVLTEART